jgi:hypothetical protein
LLHNCQAIELAWHYDGGSSSGMSSGASASQ